VKNGLCISLVAAACALAAGPAPAVAQTVRIKSRSISKIERRVLGPEHAAEHAGIRMLARMQARAWKRMTPAQRRRQERLERRRRRALARSSATLDPAVYGKWTSGPFQLPVAAIHAALLPTGKVLIFAFPFYPSTNPPSPTPVAGDAWVWDPAIDPNPDPNADPTTDPAFHHVLPPYDPETGGPASLFCAGLSMLPNGDVFVTGGTLYFADANRSQALGLKRAYTFNPWTETWIQQPDMLHGRWYPSQVELPDGRVAVLAGSNETTGANNYQLEVFSPTDDPSGVGSWAHPASADRSTDLYPHMTLMGNGKVLLAGPGQNDTALLDPATWKWSGIPAQDGRRTYGTEMIEPNGTNPPMKVTEIGGFGMVGAPSTYPALASSRVLDLSFAPPQWSAGPSLNVARADMQTLWLPDGSKLTVGGGNGMQSGSTYVLQNGKPEHQIELFDPQTGQWRLGPAQQIDRAYHSTAVLLPDGRVLSAGDDNPYVFGKPYEGSNHNSGEIYSPPYLFRGTRPQIGSAPSSADYNTPFQVSVSNVDPADAHAVLIPPAAVTHATNPAPRIVPLAASPIAGGLNLVAPINENLAPRGWYMLFVVNSDGVPSVARWIHIDGQGTPYTPPITTTTTTTTSTSSPATTTTTTTTSDTTVSTTETTTTTEAGIPAVTAPVVTSPSPTGAGAPRPKITRSVEWLTVASRQSFRRGRIVALLGLATNRTTVSASLVLGQSGAASATVLGKTTLRGRHAGTLKLVVKARKGRSLRRLLAARKVWLRVRVSAPGAPAYTTQKAIARRR